MKAITPRKRHQAFSLVELLVVIAVIGIMAGIAIPMISNINANSAKAKDKRNAQNICSVYGAARSAGAAFSSTTKEGIVGELAQGISGGGSFGSNRFQLNVSAGERAAALAYCTYDSSDEIMSYEPAGAAPAVQTPVNHDWQELRIVLNYALAEVMQNESAANPTYEYSAYQLPQNFYNGGASMLRRRLR